jgi:hypothetical protein
VLFGVPICYLLLGRGPMPQKKQKAKSKKVSKVQKGLLKSIRCCIYKNKTKRKCTAGLIRTGSTCATAGQGKRTRAPPVKGMSSGRCVYFLAGFWGALSLSLALRTPRRFFGPIWVVGSGFKPAYAGPALVFVRRSHWQNTFAIHVLAWHVGSMGWSTPHVGPRSW